MDLKKFIADVPNFPTEGVLFRDITPLMNDGAAYKYATDEFVNFAKDLDVDLVVGPEARGFIFGCPVAYAMGIGFVPVRKPGKLPRETIEFAYDLEYGTNTLSLHKDGIKPGQKVIVVDDLMATGGTIEATTALIEELGGEVVKLIFLMELAGLKGRERLSKYDIGAVITYEGK